MAIPIRRKWWDVRRKKGKEKLVSGKSIEHKFERTERCTDCEYLTRDKLFCLKNKKTGKGCKVPLLFTAICPSCGRITQSKRKWGETKIFFKCAGKTRSGDPCNTLYSLSFHGASDSAVEISKREWLAAEDGEDHWTDFSIRRF